MTMEEIMEDGVEIIVTGGRPAYKIPCEVCGRKIRRTAYSRKRTYICDYCKGVIKKREKVLIPDARTKEDIRFERAVEELGKQLGNLDKYQRAISAARSRAYQYGSIPEAMMAIYLIANGYSIIPQQKIGKYKVDFCAPKHKIVVEVDGSLFHQGKDEGLRDLVIQNSLGYDWLVLHVPAETVARNVKLAMLYIRKMEAEREKGHPKVQKV